MRRESESKNNSVVGLLKDEQEHAGEEQSSPIRESHDKNPLLEDDFGLQLIEDNDPKAKSQSLSLKEKGRHPTQNQNAQVLDQEAAVELK